MSQTQQGLRGSTVRGPAMADNLALQNHDRVPALDGLRGLAVLCVMCFHFGTYGGLQADTYAAKMFISLFCNLWSGVDIFFALSGFLITGILLRQKQGPGYFSRFYMRRTLRIFPLYYVAMIVIFVLLPALQLPALDNPGIHRVQDAQAWMWAYSQDFAITYYNNDFFDPDPLWVGHFWSLGVEEHFYLVWPLIVYLCTRRGLLLTSVLLIVVAPIVRFTMMHYDMDPAAVYTFTLSRMDQFAIGGLLALFVREQEPAQMMRWARWAAGATVLYLLVCVIGLKRSFYWSNPEALGFGFSFLALGSAALIVFAISPQHTAIRGGLELGWLRFLGKYSYGAYVLHVPLQKTFMLLFGPDRIEALAAPLGHSVAQLIGLLGFISLAIALSMLLAMVVYKLIEMPFNRLKRHYQYEVPAQRNLVSAPTFSGP
ncbi:acyltransferase family protein [Bradyrhizobium sp. McL0615]|uniref:acyltransferase family protein n=1 Tax=Bradyrhizobium sp. McL0615 TaxID=3415673 RepID=UPI003CF8C28B